MVMDTNKEPSKDGMGKVKPKPDPDECPRCGATFNDEGQLDLGDIHIDLQCGFVAIKNRCECGATLERFYDYDRTEVKEARS